MNSRKKDVIMSIRQVLTKDQIMSFVSGLHETQRQMIELTVAAKEKQGFPEASAVIKHIMEKK
jgi:hypothetical protein